MQSIPQIQAFGMTDTGLRRQLNEDAYFINTSCGCFVVSDGVGGAAAGEVASGIFISTVSETIENEQAVSEQNTISAIKKTFLKANSDIIEYACQNPDHKGMACTAELLVVGNDGFVLGHVGDSRTYRYRQNTLVRLTKDHSFTQQQIELGKITEKEAQTHRYRNVILRAVGTEETIDVDIIRGKVRSGDIFMLCSDGLTDMVAEADISACLAQAISLEQKVSFLINLANRAGGRDNITVILTLVDQHR